MNRREFIKASGAVVASSVSGERRKAVVEAAPTAAASRPSGAGGLLTGTWAFILFQYPWSGTYSDATVLWTAENWRALTRDISEIGMDTVIWGHTCYWGRPMFPADPKKVGRRLGYLACEDPMGAAADEADRRGMRFFYGLGLRERAWQVREFARMEKPWPETWFRWHAALAEALVERYGDRPSFGGLYITTEVDFQPLDVELYEKLVRQYLRPAVGKVKILVSPGNLGLEIGNLARFPKYVERTNVDIIAPQDYAGRLLVPPTYDGSNADCSKQLDWVRRQARALERVRKPLEDMGVKLWANCELMVKEPTADGGGRDTWLPGPIERIKQQIAMQCPVVEKLLCFQYPAVMNRHTNLVDIGHPSTQRLYNQYRRYLAETFPGRFRI